MNRAALVVVSGLVGIAYFADPFGLRVDDVKTTARTSPRDSATQGRVTPKAVLDGLIEPTVGNTVMPSPGSQTKPRNPNEPYDIGPTEARVPLEALSSEERAYVARLREQDHGAVNAMYAQAATQRGMQGKGDAAATQLGVEGLGELGVVP